ncbi:hypothetical protein [uncultured Hymenobacter sp.]|uniref:hypothetical protein n=1 Tax=uncultured Hymenobacter sp. TaxID=170016 RepID=UPI0035C9A2E9
MEDIRLLLNDQAVDLPEGVERLLRMQKPGTDVASLESRAGESSYTLELPFTRTNDLIFSHHRDAQTLDKFAPLVPYVARLYVNGHLFFRGVWQPSSIKGAYIGKLVSDEVDVFTAIGSKMLADLHFAPFVYEGRHGFDARLALSCAATDVQFPFVAYGNFYEQGFVLNGQEQDVPASNQVGSGLEVDEYLPSVSFVRTLRQVFADVGWRIRGEILEQEEVRELCMPFTGSAMPWNWGELLKVRCEGGVPGLGFNAFTRDAQFGGQIPLSTGGAGFWALQPQDLYSPAARWRLVEVGESGPLTDGRRAAYAVRLDGGYRLQAGLTVTALTGGPCELRLMRLEAGQRIDEGEVLQYIPLSAPGSYRLDSDVLSLNGLFLETSQTVVAVVHHPSPPANFRLEYSAWSVQVDPREDWPLTLDVAKLLPGMSQRDFLKGFVTAYNLRFTTDPTTRTLTFHLRERYELPPALALDLSDVCHPEAGDYGPALPARRIVLGWQPDESDALLSARQGFADYTYQPNRVPVGVEQDEQRLTLPWAPTVLRTYRDGLGNRVALPCLASADALATKRNEVSWSYGFTARLLVYRGVAPVAQQILPFRFRGSGQTSFGLAEFPDSLWFGGSQGLYARYYAQLFEQLLRGHLLRVNALLSPGLYARLSPAVPVLVHGSLYRLAKIPSFVVGGESETALELLRVVLSAQGGGVPAPTGEAAVGVEFYTPDEFYLEEWF